MLYITASQKVPTVWGRARDKVGKRNGMSERKDIFSFSCMENTVMIVNIVLNVFKDIFVA